MEYLLIIAIACIIVQVIVNARLKKKLLTVMEERNQWAQKALDEANARTKTLENYRDEIKKHIDTNNKLKSLSQKLSDLIE